MKWECFLCWKENEDDEAVAEEKVVCRCCGRPRTFIPKSVMIKDRAKPLVLHGLATAQHELHPKLVQSLQKAGLEFAATDSAGWTALHCAAMLGDSTAVRCLLRPDDKNSEDTVKAADARLDVLEAPRNGGWRALHLATRGGHLEVVEELLLSDADVDARLHESDDALTPLHIAAEQGHGDILNLLLQCGANPTLVTHHLYRSPLHIAAAAGHIDCVRLLLSKPDLVGILDGDGLTAIQLTYLLPPSGAASNPNQREIIALLESHQPFGAAPPTQLRSLLS